MDQQLAYNIVRRINVGDSLTRSAARAPQSIALQDAKRRWTYEEFNSTVNRVAHALKSRGMQRGDALVLAAPNCFEFLVVYYACAKLGLMCVPINLGWREQEISHVVRDSGASALVLAASLEELVLPSMGPIQESRRFVFGESPSEDLVPFSELSGYPDASEPEAIVADGDPLVCLYTSGTTSAPKGVVNSHSSVYVESLMMCMEAEFKADDVFTAMMPMFHTAQLHCHCTPAILAGATVYVMDGFDAETVLTAIEQQGVTQIFGLPMMYREMLETAGIQQRDLSSLRRAVYAMAPMPMDLLKRSHEVFDCKFYLLFGQTEMCPAATLFRPEHQFTHPGAVGTPTVNTQVGIMDETGALLPKGELGEIVYRGPQVMSGYHDNPEATAEALANGWFHSGDMGYIGDDGMLWFTDRRKDVIKTGGENVASLEVERAIFNVCPDAAEVAVVGLPHARWTEAITAFVVPRDGIEIDVESLRTALREVIDPYKIPKHIMVVDALPKTSTGKIRKNVVRENHLGLYGVSS